MANTLVALSLILDRAATDQAKGAELASESALLSCLEYVARRLNKTYSRRSVLAGLPLEPGRELTTDLFRRAAARIGLTARLLERAPSTVPAVLLPCIGVLRGGDAVVLIDRSTDRKAYQVVFPAAGDETRWIDA